MEMGLLDYFSARKAKPVEHDKYIDCPRCGKQMVKKTRQGVTIDKCMNCGGIWLDKGEIFKILHALEKEQVKNKKKR